MSLNFDAVYDCTRERVWKLCRRLSADRANAEDAFQDIYVMVFRYLPGFRGHSSVETWCFSIALNYLTRNRAKRSLPLVHRLPSDPTENPEQRKDTAILVEALQCLDSEAQQLVTMVYFCEMPQQEVANQMKMPLGTVHSRLSRAKQKLREELERRGYR